MRKLAAPILTAFVLCTGCSSSNSSDSSGPTADFTTPEGAILMLEDAYRNGDLEAAVACKDFRMEARYMLEYELSSKIPPKELTDDIIRSTAEVLELAYRAEMKASGMPDFNGLRSTFPTKVQVEKDIFRVTEVCIFPDGGTSKEDILVGRRNGKWKVLNVAN